MQASKPGCGSGEVVSVGSREKDRSHVGAFDMGGNVREWTATTYGAYPGGKADADRTGVVNRGGSYLMNGKSLSAVFTRGVDSPEEARPGLGFRCAADLK
jgi:formylglycine-generating enzyme required for sulfatase activity